MLKKCIEEAIKNLSDENIDVSIIDIDLWAYGVEILSIPSFFGFEEQKPFQKTIDEIKDEKIKMNPFDRKKYKEMFLKLQEQFNEVYNEE